MKDLIKTIYNSSKERIKNPLIGSFIISWIIFNWKPLLILFYSNSCIECKIQKIQPDSLLTEPGLWWPLLISLIYVTLIPYFMLLIDVLTKDSFLKRKVNASERRLGEISASKDVVIAEVEIEKHRTEFKDVVSLNKAISDLKEQVDHADLSIEDYEKELNEKRQEIEQLTKKSTSSEESIEELKLKINLSRKLKVGISEFLDKFHKEFKVNQSIDTTDFYNYINEIGKSLRSVLSESDIADSAKIKGDVTQSINNLEDRIPKILEDLRSIDMNESASVNEYLRPIFDSLFEKLHKIERDFPF